MQAAQQIDTQALRAEADGNIIEFYMRSKEMIGESEKAGRPIFKEFPYIRIQQPGDRLSIIDQPANEDIRKRYPLRWALFEQNQNSPSIGTPLSEWSGVSRSRADELKFFNVTTVEDLAGLTDSVIGRIGMDGQALRAKAQAFLATAEDQAVAERFAAEKVRADQENLALRRQLEEQGAALRLLQDQVARLSQGTQQPAVIETEQTVITPSRKSKMKED